MAFEVIKINEALKKEGVVKIESFLNHEQLRRCICESEALLKIENLRIDYSVGEGCILRANSFEQKKCKEISKVFYSRFFHSISKMFFKSAFSLNEEIFIVKDIVGSSHHANDLHFDVKHTLKFYIYLSDTNETNGAFRCVPKSHKWTEDFRKQHSEKISYENREISRDLPNLGSEISMNGRAGDLIIFDTNMFHRAGKVNQGERLVIRGHSRRTKRLGLFDKVVAKFKLDIK